MCSSDLGVLEEIYVIAFGICCYGFVLSVSMLNLLAFGFSLGLFFLWIECCVGCEGFTHPWEGR